MDVPVSKLNILRAAIFMFADSMLADLRTIRNATTVEEAQAPVNLMIDRLIRLSEAAEATDGLPSGAAGAAVDPVQPDGSPC